MGRHLESRDFSKIGMRIRVEGIGEQRLNLGTAIAPRWQRDAMYNDQLGHRPLGSGVTIRRRHATGSCEPALGDLPLVSGSPHGVILSQTWESERCVLLSIFDAVGTIASHDHP